MVGTHDKYVPIIAIREGFNLYASIGYTINGKQKKPVVSSVSFQVFDMERLLLGRNGQKSLKKTCHIPNLIGIFILTHKVEQRKKSSLRDLRIHCKAVS